MHKRINPREARRMMQKMGLDMEQMGDVAEVVIRTGGKELVIEQPEVSILNVQGQKIYQITGGTVTERAAQKPTQTAPSFSEEDVRLVADQTGKSVEEAKKALEESGGDLARAILLLQT